MFATQNVTRSYIPQLGLRKTPRAVPIYLIRYHNITRKPRNTWSFSSIYSVKFFFSEFVSYNCENLFFVVEGICILITILFLFPVFVSIAVLVRSGVPAVNCWLLRSISAFWKTSLRFSTDKANSSDSALKANLEVRKSLSTSATRHLYAHLISSVVGQCQGFVTTKSFFICFLKYIFSYRLFWVWTNDKRMFEQPSKKSVTKTHARHYSFFYRYHAYVYHFSDSRWPGQSKPYNHGVKVFPVNIRDCWLIII